MPRIFINYRRDDSSPYAGRIYDNLASHFGAPNIFMDIENLRPGDDFAEKLESSVASCDALLAIIGPQWLSAKDNQGLPRLSGQNDLVALEIAAALVRPGILVVPVLVNGASIPRDSDLPARIKDLSRRHALELNDRGFRQSLQTLIERINQHCSNPKSSSPGNETRNVEPREKRPEANPPGRTLAEDLYLLCANPKDGDIAFQVIQVGCFSFAQIADLVLLNRITLEMVDLPHGVRRVQSKMRDRTPTGDPLLDVSLESLRSAQPGEFPSPPQDDIIQRVRERLQGQGIVERKVRPRWLFSPVTYYPLISATTLNELRLQFASAIEASVDLSDRMAALAGIITITDPLDGVSASLWTRARDKAKRSRLGNSMVELTDQAWQAIVDDGASNFCNAS